MNPKTANLAALDAVPAVAAAAENWERVSALPCEVSVEIPVARLKLGRLLELQVGDVLTTAWRQRQEVPVRANRVTLGWGEFDVVGERLAVRLLRL